MRNTEQLKLCKDCAYYQKVEYFEYYGDTCLRGVATIEEVNLVNGEIELEEAGGKTRCFIERRDYPLLSIDGILSQIPLLGKHFKKCGTKGIFFKPKNND